MNGLIRRARQVMWFFGQLNPKDMNFTVDATVMAVPPCCSRQFCCPTHTEYISSWRPL